MQTPQTPRAVARGGERARGASHITATRGDGADDDASARARKRRAIEPAPVASGGGGWESARTTAALELARLSEGHAPPPPQFALCATPSHAAAAATAAVRGATLNDDAQSADAAAGTFARAKRADGSCFTVRLRSLSDEARANAPPPRDLRAPKPSSRAAASAPLPLGTRVGKKFDGYGDRVWAGVVVEHLRNGDVLVSWEDETYSEMPATIAVACARRDWLTRGDGAPRPLAPEAAEVSNPRARARGAPTPPPPTLAPRKRPAIDSLQTSTIAPEPQPASSVASSHDTLESAALPQHDLTPRPFPQGTHVQAKASRYASEYHAGHIARVHVDRRNERNPLVYYDIHWDGEDTKTPRIPAAWVECA